MNRLCFVAMMLLALWTTTGPSPADEEKDLLQVDEEERIFEAAGLSCEGPGLVEFFLARARTEAEPGRIDDLVRKITGPSSEVRLQAGADLVAGGPLAIAGLRRVVNDLETPEARELAKRCLAHVEGAESTGLLVAAARLTARRKPSGAAAALLAYLPFADNEEVLREVRLALDAVAFIEGKPDPVLMRALTDPVPLRRAAAGAALGQAAPTEHQAVEKLLKDSNPEVRMNAALALAKANNPAAIPVLIDLLGVLSIAKRTLVEEVLQELAGDWAPAGGPAAEDEIARRIRRDAWAAWWANTEGPALIALFTKNTLTPLEQEKVKDSIRRLGDKSFATREKAVVELVSRGRMILPMLREALKESELEVVRRAQRCIERIELEPANRMPAAAVRILALRRPPGAAEALLAYLPFAEEDLAEEMKSALVLAAMRDGKPDPAFLKALASPVPVIRGAAGEALAQVGDSTQRAMVAKLLTDPDLSVRQRVAQALAPREAQAIPVLIQLLAESPSDRAGQIHDFLFPLAGDKAPPPPDETADSRKKNSAAWSTWWVANAAKTDTAKLTRPQLQNLGYTVIAKHDTGEILELGRDHKPRWSFSGTRNPVDAWVLPNQRVAVAEFGGNLVTLRDLKGKIIWSKNTNGNPHNLQPLPNGNIFIATNVQLLEVDRNGKDVPLPINNNIGNLINNLGQITGAYKTRNGHYVLMGQNGQCVRLDANGKQLKSFNTNRNNAWIDVLANGRVIAAQNGGNQIAEYDADGKLLVELNVNQVSMVTGLPSGNFLVACHSLGKMMEMDRKGKVLWEYQTQGPFRARGR